MNDDKNPDTRDEFVIEGEHHFHNSDGQYRNPYLIYSDEFNRFERGWMQALKRSHVDTPNHAATEREYRIRTTPQTSMRDPSIERQAAEYKSRKG